MQAVKLNRTHRQKIIRLVRQGVSKQEVLNDFMPLVSDKQKLLNFIAQVPSAGMRARYGVLNYLLAALIGFLFLVNIVSANYMSATVSGILLYLVVTFQTYHYGWISILSVFGLLPVVFLLTGAIIHRAPQQVIAILLLALVLGIAILVMGVILNTRLSTKYTARMVTKTGENGRTYKTFEYTFIEEQ